MVNCPNCGYGEVRRINFIEWCSNCGTILVGNKHYIPFESDWRRKNDVSEGDTGTEWP